MSLVFVRGIHQSLVNSLHKGPVTWKMFPFDDVLMMSMDGYTICFVYIISIEIWTLITMRQEWSRTPLMRQSKLVLVMALCRQAWCLCQGWMTSVQSLCLLWTQNHPPSNLFQQHGPLIPHVVITSSNNLQIGLFLLIKAEWRIYASVN